MSDWDELLDWLTHGGKDAAFVIAVLVSAYVAFRIVFPRVARAAILRGAHPADDEAERRATTIIGVVQRSAWTLILLVAAVTVLAEAGIEITAIVTGLGITGLAVALGAQPLVRDVINGVFLLAEDQYRGGDVVGMAGVKGTVEAVTLRRTIIRDEDGVVHSVPNGVIDVVSNYTRDYARVNVRVDVAYGEAISRVTAIVERVGAELAQDSRYSHLITDGTIASRVEAISGGGVAMMVSIRSRPAARWEVASELRRRLVEAFLAEGVQIANGPGTTGADGPPARSSGGI